MMQQWADYLGKLKARIRRFHSYTPRAYWLSVTTDDSQSASIWASMLSNSRMIARYRIARGEVI
jgi:hypothetical protein